MARDLIGQLKDDPNLYEVAQKVRAGHLCTWLLSAGPEDSVRSNRFRHFRWDEPDREGDAVVIFDGPANDKRREKAQESIKGVIRRGNYDWQTVKLDENGIVL